jgi:archaellum component FlaC
VIDETSDDIVRAAATDEHPSLRRVSTHAPETLMTNLTLMTDAAKPVGILNSGEYLVHYAGDPKPGLTEGDAVTIETLLKSIDGRLQTMDKRLENMDVRLGNMDTRLDNIDERLNGMDVRLQKVSDEIVELKIQTTAIGVRLNGVELRFDHMDIRFNRTDDRFARMEDRQTDMNAQLIRIETNVAHLPTWRSVGATSAAMTVGCCGIVSWLAEGGAKTLARFFE